MLDRPIVGIATAASGFNNCHRTTPDLVGAVSRGVLAAGDVVGVQIDHVSPETLGMADELLALLEVSLPTPLGRTILA